MNHWTRRGFLTTGTVAAAGLASAGLGDVAASPLAPTFPSTDPGLAMEIVRVSHFDLDRVAELLAEDRALALASWDWGFGDWESALGAASHMGRKDIARLLIDHGARPNLFTWSMMDEVDAVRAVCRATPGIQRVRGPHGITLLAHAEVGKAERVAAYLRELGGADVGETGLDLAEDQAEVYLGDYVAEGEESVRLAVEKNRDGGIGILRSGGTRRRLRRTGEHVFSPAGAPQVAVRFTLREGRVTGLTIERGRRLLSASRVAG